MADVVAFERFGGFVGTKQSHTLGRITLTLLAAVFPIAHVVILSSSPPWVLVPRRHLSPQHTFAPHILPKQIARVVAIAGSSVPAARRGSTLEQLLLLVLEGLVHRRLLLVRELVELLLRPVEVVGRDVAVLLQRLEVVAR